MRHDDICCHRKRGAPGSSTEEAWHVDSGNYNQLIRIIDALETLLGDWVRWKELGREERQETMQGKHDTAGESFGKGSKRKFYFYQPGRGHGRLCSLQHLAGLLSPLLTGGGQTSMIKASLSWYLRALWSWRAGKGASRWECLCFLYLVHTVNGRWLLYEPCFINLNQYNGLRKEWKERKKVPSLKEKKKRLY